MLRDKTLDFYIEKHSFIIFNALTQKQNTASKGRLKAFKKKHDKKFFNFRRMGYPLFLKNDFSAFAKNTVHIFNFYSL